MPEMDSSDDGGSDHENENEDIATSANSSSDTDSSDSGDCAASANNESRKSQASYSTEDFVIVKFVTKKSVLNYVAKLIKLADEGNSREWTVQFLRKQPGPSTKFVFPPVDQTYDGNVKDFVLKLPPPDSGSKRHIVFSGVDFAQYNMH